MLVPATYPSEPTENRCRTRVRGWLSLQTQKGYRRKKRSKAAENEAKSKQSSDAASRSFDWDEFWPQLVDGKNGSGGTFVPKEFVRITGHSDDAILLSQVVYWFRKGRNGSQRARLGKVGDHRWVAKTAKGWEAELGIPVRKIRRSINRLRARGYIITKGGGFDGKKALYYRLDDDVIVKALCVSIQDQE